jgi:hypothetical protein
LLLALSLLRWSEGGVAGSDAVFFLNLWLQVLLSPSSAVKMKLPMPAVEARWGFFVELQGVLLFLS